MYNFKWLNSLFWFSVVTIMIICFGFGLFIGYSQNQKPNVTNDINKVRKLCRSQKTNYFSIHGDTQATKLSYYCSDKVIYNT